MLPPNNDDLVAGIASKMSMVADQISKASSFPTQLPEAMSDLNDSYKYLSSRLKAAICKYSSLFNSHHEAHANIHAILQLQMSEIPTRRLLPLVNVPYFLSFHREIHANVHANLQRQASRDSTRRLLLLVSVHYFLNFHKEIHANVDITLQLQMSRRPIQRSPLPVYFQRQVLSLL